MGKYIKAGLLLIFTVTPVVLALIFIFGGDPTTEYNGENNNYLPEEPPDYIERNYYEELDEPEDVTDPRVTTLRLGALSFPWDIVFEVDLFNWANDLYYIEIVEIWPLYYAAYDGSQYEEYDVIDMTRILQESMNALLHGDFDIILISTGFLLHYSDASFAWVDLYELIDADFALNRTDFFPNVLSSGEAPDGTLPLFTLGFALYTMVSMQGVAEQITPLTFENLHRHLSENDSLKFITADTYLPSLINMIFLGSENHFIDIERGIANFYNDDFISALEIFRYVTEHPGRGFVWDYVDVYELMAHSDEVLLFNTLEAERFERGEILLSPFIMTDPMQFHIMMAALEEAVVVGVPSAEGGNHFIIPHNQIGINADSPHQDAAWSFMQQLMRHSHTYTSIPSFLLPTRISTFENEIEQLTRPVFHGGTEHPRAREWSGLSGQLPPEQIYVYAATMAETTVIRELITSAVVIEPGHPELSEIIIEETETFIRENRSAEETARVIQSRVQEFFDSRR